MTRRSLDATFVDKIKDHSDHDVASRVPVQMLEVEALRKQLEAMETAFALQERSLAASGVEATMQNQYHDQSTRHIDRDYIQNFPYTKLLQTWRMAVVQNIHSRLVMESQICHYRDAEKSLRHKLKSVETQFEASKIGWKERFNASQSKRESLQQDVDMLNKESARLQQQNGSLDYQLTQSRRLISQFR